MVRVVGANGVGRIIVDFEVANHTDVENAQRGLIEPDEVRRATIKGVVDSGAAKMVLPRKTVKQIGLRLSGNVEVHYADGRTATRPTIQGVQVTILGRQGTFSAIVEPNRKTALIGAIVLEDLDLLVDCTHQRLIPRDPRTIISEVE